MSTRQMLTFLPNGEILSTTNDIMDAINNSILMSTVYVQKQRQSDQGHHRDYLQSAISSPDNLNAINVTGIPPHKLTLKKSLMLMITRNLNLSEGVVNGQKVELLAVSARSRVQQVLILDDTNTTVLIPHSPNKLEGNRWQR